MADTYHPQPQFNITTSYQLLNTSSEVPADSIITQPDQIYDEDLNRDQILNTSTQIPMHREIVVEMELYAPGLLTSWPDNLKPQYRVPEYATEVAAVVSSFPALTVAF
jgi:hypothetical protein